MNAFLALLVAHLLGDFVLQRRAVVDSKGQGRLTAYAEHGAVHLLCLVAAWLLFGPAAVGYRALALVFVAIVVLHLLSDYLKYRVAPGHEVTAFVLDQVFHLLVLVVAAWLLLGRPDWVDAVLGHRHELAGSAALVTAAYLIVVVGCGWLNRLLLGSLMPSPSTGDDALGLARAGLRIGFLERFLMFSAFLVEAWAAVALVLAAKSVFRFESIRADRSHAEYFVIGTLLSVSQVVVVGMLYWLARPLVAGGS